MNKFKNLTAPFDLVMLPSMGLFYEHKKPYVLVSYLTGKEEDILTNPMLAEYGLALDMALENLILDDDIELNKLLVGDKNAILLFLRATAYGPTFDIQIMCQKCDQLGKTSFDISQLTAKDLIVMPDEMGEYTFILPKMRIKGNQVIVKFRPLTYADEKKIKQQDKQQQERKPGLSVSTTLKYFHQITSINDETDKEMIMNVIKKMPIKDSTSLRMYIEKVEPGINSTVSLQCPHCKHTMRENFDVNNNILSLPAEYKNSIWEECFLLWYYSKGGLTRDMTFNISTAERRWSIERIREEIQKKHDAEKKANEQSQRRN